MNRNTLRRLAVLMLGVQLLPLAEAANSCARFPTECGCPGQPPCPPLPPEPPPPPPPPPPGPPGKSYWIGAAQGILENTADVWRSLDEPDNPVPVSTTRVVFGGDSGFQAWPGGSLLSLTMDGNHSWEAMSANVDLTLQLGGNSLRLNNFTQPAPVPALAVMAGQTRLLNGTVHANAGDVRIGSGSTGASLVLGSGAQLLMESNNLRKVSVGTGGFGTDGLLRIESGAVLRTDTVQLGSSIAAASGRLELDGAGSLLDVSLLTIGGTANGANGVASVRNGAVLRTQGLTVTGHALTTGELTVDGAGSQLALRGGAVNIGALDNGRLNITGGAAVVGEDATLITLGNGQLLQTSVVRVEGSSTRISNVGIQVLPSGTLEIRDGARWDAGGTQGVNALAIQAGTVRFVNAQVTLVDATLEGLATEVLNPDGTRSLNVIKTGLWDVGNGSKVTVTSLVAIEPGSQLLVHDSGTSFSGFTDMTLNGYLSVHNGAELRGGLIALGHFGQLGGNLGRIHADVMGSDGSITPGQSPGRLEIDGNVTLGGLATLELEIAGLDAGVSYDVLQVSGNLQMSGGRVVLRFLDGFAPKAGDVFDLLQVGGSLALSGSVPVEVEGLQAGWTFDLQQGEGHGLRLVSLNQGVSAVPEPAIWALWLVGAGVMLGFRRRR